MNYEEFSLTKKIFFNFFKWGGIAVSFAFIGWIAYAFLTYSPSDSGYSDDEYYDEEYGDNFPFSYE